MPGTGPASLGFGGRRFVRCRGGWPPSLSVGSAAVTPTATGRRDRAATSRPVPSARPSTICSADPRRTVEAEATTDPTTLQCSRSTTTSAACNPAGSRSAPATAQPVTVELTDLSGVALSRPTRRRRRPGTARQSAGPGRPPSRGGSPHRGSGRPACFRRLASDRGHTMVRRAATTPPGWSRRNASPVPVAWPRSTPPTPTGSGTRTPRTRSPLLLVLLDELPAESLGRWSALLADAPRLGIAVSSLPTARLPPDASSSTPSGRSPRPNRRCSPSSLIGVELFGLDADETVELLGAVNEANHEGDERRPRLYRRRPSPPCTPPTTTRTPNKRPPVRNPGPKPLRRSSSA